MRRCCPIATIVELVTELIEPAIQAPFELVDVEYEKVVGDYVLSIFVAIGQHLLISKRRRYLPASLSYIPTVKYSTFWY